MKSIRRHLLLAAVVALGLAACKPAPQVAFKGVDITGADYARELNLPDVDGKPRSLADFKGKAVLVFFGYTQCPDVCPTTMAELAEVKRQLGPDGERVQGVFVTLDPERDTAALLKPYVAGFDPSFVALRGTAEQTQAAAKAFKVFYEKVPSKDGSGNYTLDHTAAAYLFDPQGR
ncbi:MAG TPA: SCO family protein, partial [Methylibium sp.]